MQRETAVLHNIDLHQTPNWKLEQKRFLNLCQLSRDETTIAAAANANGDYGRRAGPGVSRLMVLVLAPVTSLVSVVGLDKCYSPLEYVEYA